MASGSNPYFGTKIMPYGAAAIEEAARLLLAGEPVAVPTETVYGLAADATNRHAVARIYEAKGRPSFNPLIVHVRDRAMAGEIAHFDELADRLAAHFWPGPLTLVLPQRAGHSIASIATAGLDTIALRCPAHPAMQAAIAATGRPLAAPSANASGRISPSSAAHVVASLEGRIPLVIDAGPCPAGLESTIVAPRGDHLLLLRPGPVTIEDLEAVTGLPVRTDNSGTITAPGQLASHYAPGKPVQLDCTAPAPDRFLIGFGAMGGDYNLSAAGDLTEAASRLFDALHAGDASDAAQIGVVPIPASGLGQAINDRLRRAAV